MLYCFCVVYVLLSVQVVWIVCGVDVYGVLFLVDGVFGFGVGDVDGGGVEVEGGGVLLDYLGVGLGQGFEVGV